MMISDFIFRVIFNETSKIAPAFLAATLATADLRDQIEERRTGAAPMMQKITKSTLMSLRLPRPPKAKQAGLVATLNEARTAAADLRRQAIEARAEAWTNFDWRAHQIRAEHRSPPLEVLDAFHHYRRTKRRNGIQWRYRQEPSGMLPEAHEQGAGKTSNDEVSPIGFHFRTRYNGQCEFITRVLVSRQVIDCPPQSK